MLLPLPVSVRTPACRLSQMGVTLSRSLRPFAVTVSSCVRPSVPGVTLSQSLRTIRSTVRLTVDFSMPRDCPS